MPFDKMNDIERKALLREMEILSLPAAQEALRDAKLQADQLHAQRELAIMAQVQANTVASNIPSLECNGNLGSARDLCEIIVSRIEAFERALDTEHEVSVKLASFGQNITLSVTDIDYLNPNILLFSGYVGGQFSTLIQHISQLNFLLVAVKKTNPEKPARRIGFGHPSRD